MKNKMIKLFPLTAAFLGTVLAGCTSAPAVEGEEVVQVRLYKGGYGREFFDELAKAFEEAFPGKKIKIEEASGSVTTRAEQEIYALDSNQIDLYLTNSTPAYEIIGKSKSTLRTSTKTLLEDLTDVVESPAIGKDGKEESRTIKERLFQGYQDLIEYHGPVEKWDGRIFSVPWADATTGIFVNKAVMNKYGLEMPLTTNEFKACVDEIASHTEQDQVYPFSWGGSNAPGYWSYLFETWFAQYSGTQGFINFMKCDPGDGDIQFKGYEVYHDEGILKSLQAMFPILDLNYSVAGSSSMNHYEAQVDFFEQESAFIVDGDWVYCEMKEDYNEEGKVIEMLPAPILSCIGEELGITDAQLHTVVAAIDDGKTNAEVMALVPTLNNDGVQRVRNARSVHCGIGAGHNMFIPEYSDAKETAKQFIRFMYSEDGCEIFRKYTYANLPLKCNVSNEEIASQNDFQKSLTKMANVENPQMVTGSGVYNEVRNSAQLFLFNVNTWVHAATYKSIMINKYNVENGLADAKTLITPEDMFEKEYQYVKSSWEGYMTYVF